MSDFTVQFVSGTIPSSTATVNVNSPVFTQLADPTKAFMVPANPLGTAGIGRTTGAYNNSLLSISAIAKIVDIDTVQFDDGDATVARNNFCGGWLFEYTGPVGGINEVVVRAVQDIVGTAGTFDGPAISGIGNIAKCVPFLFTSSLGVANATNAHTARAEVVNDGVNNVVRITKGNITVQLTARVYVVEFVGSNWTVQKVTHSFVADNTNEDEVISAITVADSFVYTTAKMSSGSNDNNLFYIWLANGTTLRHRILNNQPTAIVTTSYVITNAQMDVAVYGADPDGTSDLSAGGGSPETRTVSVTAVPQLNAAFCIGHLGSDTADQTNTGACFSLLDLQDESTVRIRRADNVGATEYKIQVIDLSQVIGLSIDSVETIIDGTNFSIQGHFGTLTGNGVTLGGVTQVAVSANSTTVTRTGTLGTLKYGVGLDLVVSAGSNVTAANVSINPPATKNYVNLSTLTGSGQRLTANPDLAPGDQVEWSNVVGGTIADVTVFDDGSFSSQPAVTAFDFRANDGTGWGTIATQTISNQASDTMNIIMRLVTDFTRLITFPFTNIEHDT